MFKFLILITIVLILSINSVYSETVLTGGVNYTVAQTRKIAFQNIPNKISAKTFEKFLKYKKRFVFRYIKTTFSDNSFGVLDKKTEYGYYYTEKGNLYLIQVKITDGNFRKYARYDLNGQLESIVLDIGNNEQFIFDANKKLVAHWIGENGYNEKGELIFTRNKL